MFLQSLFSERSQTWLCPKLHTLELRYVQELAIDSILDGIETRFSAAGPHLVPMRTVRISSRGFKWDNTGRERVRTMAQGGLDVKLGTARYYGFPVEVIDSLALLRYLTYHCFKDF